MGDPLAASGKTNCPIAKDRSLPAASSFTDVSEGFGETGIRSILAIAASSEAAGDGVVKWGDADFFEVNPPPEISKAFERGFDLEDPLPLPFSWYFNLLRVRKSTSFTEG